MSASTFESLALDERIQSALREIDYQEPTEIQSATIPLALEGRDLMATAQTGTGKTAAFVLPILQRMYQEKDNHPKRILRALILSPTRELAQQIEASVTDYAKYLPFNVLSVVGGLPIQRQIRKLQKGVDVLVATPGRLLDLMKRKEVNLRRVDFFVLDEADRMLDMGFVHDVQDIAKVLKKDRQTFFFSATTSPDVISFSRSLLQNPEKVEAHPPDTVGENIESKVLFVERKDKRDLVAELLQNKAMERVLVFTATKSDASVLAAVLSRKDITADAIHSDKSQKERQRALSDFEEGKTRVLVATDVMARGIDVTNITHVINYDLPHDPENFVHRIGRTARAGTSGVAISFCDLDEVKLLQAIERFTGETLNLDDSHSFHSPLVQTMKNQKNSPFARRGRGGRGSSRSSGRRRIA